jgi:HptB-dependent secretion and biofilm anti anti-sigma factor
VKYEIIDAADGPTLVVRDQLTFADREVFDTAIDKLLARRSATVAVDLGGLDYMDSAGLGMLLTLRDRADQAKAAVKLKRPKGEVRELLTLACFDTLFTIVEI